MPPTSTATFLDLVRKSELVEGERLESCLAAHSSRHPTTPAALAEILVREGLLTPFHARNLLQGKFRGFHLGKYRVLELIGTGGMGRVYLCEHRIMNRACAVKVLPTERLQADPAALPRLYREARAAAAFDHPNIARAYDIDQEGKHHFLVMEYVDGVNFHDLVARRGSLTVERAVDTVRQAAWGLEHAREAGWVHRDIKPGNLMVDRHGVVKILDMGLARLFSGPDDKLTKALDPDALLGTADFISPEQATGSGEVDIRSDIYSLGGTFFFLLTGQGPFEGGTVVQKILWHQFRPPRSVRSVRQDTPESVEAVLAKMLAKRPEDRYQTPSELAEDLAAFPPGPFVPAASEMPTHCPRVMVLLQSRGGQESSGAFVRTGTASSWTRLGRESPSVASRAPARAAGGAEGAAPPVAPASSTDTPRRPRPVDPKSGRPRRRRSVWLWPGVVAGGVAGTLGVAVLLWAVGVFSDAPAPTPSRQASAGDKRPAPPLPPGVIEPKDARTHLNERMTVQMRVENVGTSNDGFLIFLNSEKDYTRGSNFTVVIPSAVQESLKDADVTDLRAHFQSQVVRVTGVIRLFKDKPQIRIEEAKDLELVTE